MAFTEALAALVEAWLADSAADAAEVSDNPESSRQYHGRAD
jgi:hypothetical protein